MIKLPPYMGPDALGAVKYPTTLLKFIRELDRGVPVGVMLRTFGDARKIVRDLAGQTNVFHLVVHVAPFDYSHRYPVRTYAGDKFWGDISFLQGVATANAHPLCEIFISPFCEHKHPARTMAPIFERIRKLAPDCRLVNSIYGGGEVVPGVPTEIHLPNSKPVRIPPGQYTVAADGFGGKGEGDFPDSDVEKVLSRYSDAIHFRWWNFRMNGKFGHTDDSSISRRKSWPDIRYLKGHQAMMKRRDGGLLPEDRLWKPFADDHGSIGVTKDNKALVILHTPAKEVNIRDLNGKVVDTFRRFGDDHTGVPKGGRFYSKRYAYEIGDLCEKNTGRRVALLPSGEQFDTDLRSGHFR